MKYFIYLSFITSTILLGEDIRVLDVVIGGQSIGEKAITISDNIATVDDNITFGHCDSNNLYDIAKHIEFTDSAALITPKNSCLSHNDVSFSQKKDFHFAESRSAFANYSLYQNMNQDAGLSLGVGAYLYSTLFYAQGSAISGDGGKFEQAYALKDFDAYRFKVGTIFAAGGSSLTGGDKLTGISIQSHNNVYDKRKLFDYQLIIDTRSTIEIYNRNQLVQKLSLDAGIYNLKDLPISYFSNEIRIVVTDQFGKTRNVDIPYLYSWNALTKGTSEYQLSVGTNELGEPKAIGYYRYGLLDNLTTGASTDSDTTALTADYVSMIGKFGAQVAWQKAAVDYSYSTDKYYFNAFASAIKTKGNSGAVEFGNLTSQEYYKEDIRFEGGVNFTDTDRANIFYHKNGEEFWGATYIKNFQKPSVNFSLNGLYNRSLDSYELTFRAIFNFNVDRRTTTLISSINRNADKDQTYIAASMPLRGDKDVGGEITYTKDSYTIGEDMSTYTASIRGRYKNDYWLNARQVRNQTFTDFGVSGGIGCVFAEGTKCAIGETILPDSAFVLEGDEIKRTPPYYTTEARNTTSSIPVTLRPGQGYWADPALFRTYAGTISLDGMPYAEKNFMVGGQKNFTSLDGSFWVENVVGSDLPSFEISGAICKSENLNIDRELQEIAVKCTTKETK